MCLFTLLAVRCFVSNFEIQRTLCDVGGLKESKKSKKFFYKKPAETVITNKCCLSNMIFFYSLHEEMMEYVC